jgi:cbb3-type cytochrome oxidase subunit 3
MKDFDEDTWGTKLFLLVFIGVVVAIVFGGF